MQISAMPQKMSTVVCGNLYCFVFVCKCVSSVVFSDSVSLETPLEEFWEFVWVALHAWAEIRSSPKIPLSMRWGEGKRPPAAAAVDREWGYVAV